MSHVITGFTKNQLSFLAYLKKNFPGLYAKALTDAGVPPGSTLGEIVPTMGATSTSTSGSSFWSGIVNSLSNLGTAYLGYTSQQKILNTQLARAQQGLPPLNASAYTVPVPVQVGLSSQTAAQLGTTVSSGLAGMSTPLIIGLGIIGVAVFFKSKKRG